MAQKQRRGGARPGAEPRVQQGAEPRTRGRTTGVPEAGARSAGRRARQRQQEIEAARRRRLTIWLGGGTVLVVALIIAAALLLNRPSSQGVALTDPNKFNPTSQPLKVGQPAPDFNLATVGGTQYRLSSLRGHPVLIELFAVWCPHCQRETAILNQLDKDYTPKGLRSMSILASPFGKNFDTSGQLDRRLADKGDITWFAHTFQVTQPLLIDPTYATVNRYGLVNSGYPTIYVLDSKGIVRYAKSGDQPYGELAAAVQKAGAS